MTTQQEQGAGGLGQGNPVECIAREQTATRMIVLTYRYSVYEYTCRAVQLYIQVYEY